MEHARLRDMTRNISHKVMTLKTNHTALETLGGFTTAVPPVAHPCTKACNSATIASAIDSGVRPPRAKPTGACRRGGRQGAGGARAEGEFSRGPGGPNQPPDRNGV